MFIAVYGFKALTHFHGEKGMKHYIHHIPGRLRIKNPLFKANPTILQEARNCFAGTEGIRKVSISELTGSILVEYDPQVIDEQRLITVFQECEYLDVTRAVTLDQAMKSSITRVGQYAGKVGLSLFMDRALSGTGLSFIAALI